MIAIYLALFLGAVALSAWGFVHARPALGVFSAFCAIYLCLRPLMLLTGFYTEFAWLQFGGRTFESGDLWLPLIYSVLAGAIVLAAYRYTAPAPRALAERYIPGNGAHLAVALLWLAVTAAYIAGSGLSVLGWLLPFVVFGTLALLLSIDNVDRAGRLLLATPLLLALTFALLQSEERRDWAVALIALTSAFFFSRHRRTAIKLAGLPIMLASIAFLAIALRAGENISLVATATQFERASPLTLVEVQLDFPIVYDDLVVLFDEVPENVPHLAGVPMLKPLYAWIPRAIWPDKPETLSRQYSEDFNRHFHAEGGSEPVTFVGELYWNLGWAGLALLPALGIGLRFLDERTIAYSQLHGYARRLGALPLANYLVMAAMTFYLLRGPIDTFWLMFAVYFCLHIVARAVQAAAHGLTVAPTPDAR